MSSLSNLRSRIISEGIEFIPSKIVYYSRFPYKVTVNPKFKGVGPGNSGVAMCKINTHDLVKGRKQLVEFNDRMEMIFKNIELQKEIQNYMNELPPVDYKIRSGGTNQLYYFHDESTVLCLVNQYKDFIGSVTGPISIAHSKFLNTQNVIFKEKLFYDKYRYMIEFTYNYEFAQNCAQSVADYLDTLDTATWRANSLNNCIQSSNLTSNSKTNTPPHPRWGPVMSTARYGYNQPVSAQGQKNRKKVAIYLNDGNDYVYLKLMAVEYITNNCEIMLFDELT